VAYLAGVRPLAGALNLALVHGYASATAWAAGPLVLGSMVTVILINADPAPHAAQRPAS
jgi:hypothetical protein